MGYCYLQKNSLNFSLCLSEPKKSSPTNKAKSSAEWNWLILGFVVGLIVLNIVILVVGFL